MRFFIYTFLVLSICNNAFAKNITLDEAISHAIENSPLFLEIKANTQGTFGEEIDNNTLQNPEAEFTYRADNSSEIALAQPFRISDITFKRYNYKQSLKHLKSMEQRLDLLRINHVTTQKYFELYALSQEYKFLNQQLSLSQKVQKNINSAMYSNLSSAEMLVLNAENKALATKVATLKKNLANQKMAFRQELNINEKDLSLSEPSSFVMPKNVNALIAKLPDFPNQKKILSLRYEQAKKRLDIINQDRFMPTISPKIGYGIKSYEKSDDWNVGIGFSIPLWNQSSGQAAFAKAEAKAYKAQINSLENISFDELIEKQFALLKENNSQLLIYKNQIIPQFKKASKKMEERFLSGSVSALDLLQVRDKEWNAKRDYLQLLLETSAAKNQLEMMIGTRLEDL